MSVIYTSQVTPSERQVEPSSQHSPGLSPLLSSLITKGIWLIVLLLYATKKDTNKSYFVFLSDGNQCHKAVSLKKPGVWDEIILKNFL